MSGCSAGGIPIAGGVTILGPFEANGGFAVNIQDQTTQPVDAYFAQALSNFTISVNTGVSGVTAGTLVYSFTATAGHGISPGDEIILHDTAANRAFYAEVLSVAVNTITIDRPIDHSFQIATTLGRIVTTHMNVNGSVTPQIFTVRSGTIPTDFVRFIITITNNTAMDYSKFGGLTALTRGFVFRIVNAFQKTIFCFKTDAEIAQYCYDASYASKAPAGEYGFRARITFGGQDKHGVVLRIGENDYLQWVVQDDLSSLLSLRVAAQGHFIQD